MRNIRLKRREVTSTRTGSDYGSPYMVIAIRDSPIVHNMTNTLKHGELVQAYKTGDKFEVKSTFSGQIVVLHPKFGVMAFDSSNFESLEYNRNKKLENLGV